MSMLFLQNEMKENLLLKIIPKHLLDAMKKLVYQKMMEIDRGPEKIFYDILVERHDGVRSVHWRTRRQEHLPINGAVRNSTCS